MSVLEMVRRGWSTLNELSNSKNMKNTKIKSALLIAVTLVIASCGIQEQSEEKWNQFQERVEKLDSVFDQETDRIHRLDSLIDEEIQRIEKLDSLITN